MNIVMMNDHGPTARQHLRGWSSGEQGAASSKHPAGSFKAQSSEGLFVPRTITQQGLDFQALGWERLLLG